MGDDPAPPAGEKGLADPVPLLDAAALGATLSTFRLPCHEEIQWTASGSGPPDVAFTVTGSALPVVGLTGLRSSLDAAARVLAPSERARDTPLGRTGPPARLGPAAGRSGAYPDGTHTCRSDTASMTHHGSDSRACAALLGG